MQNSNLISNNSNTKIFLSKTSDILIKIAAVSAAILAIFNAYSFYKNNVWHPTIIVKDVDFNNGIANLIINGRPFVLKGDSKYLIQYDWGIQFGTINLKNNTVKYDRIEVLKRGMVHEIIR